MLLMSTSTSYINSFRKPIMRDEPQQVSAALRPDSHLLIKNLIVWHFVTFEPRLPKNPSGCYQHHSMSVSTPDISGSVRSATTSYDIDMKQCCTERNFKSDQGHLASCDAHPQWNHSLPNHWGWHHSLPYGHAGNISPSCILGITCYRGD